MVVRGALHIDAERNLDLGVVELTRRRHCRKAINWPLIGQRRRKTCLRLEKIGKLLRKRLDLGVVEFTRCVFRGLRLNRKSSYLYIHSVVYIYIYVNLLLLLLFPHICPISRTRGHRRRLPFPYHRYIQKTQTKEERGKK